MTLGLEEHSEQGPVPTKGMRSTNLQSRTRLNVNHALRGKLRVRGGVLKRRLRAKDGMLRKGSNVREILRRRKQCTTNSEPDAVLQEQRQTASYCGKKLWSIDEILLSVRSRSTLNNSVEQRTTTTPDEQTCEYGF
jgi:hypothetical protein